MKKYLSYLKYVYFASLVLLVFILIIIVGQKVVFEPEFFWSNINFFGQTDGLINQQNFPTIKETVPETKVTLIAVGDIMLSRNVEAKMIKYQDWHYPFLKTADFLKSADITFGNLETAIMPGRVIKTGEMVFRTDPKAVEGLVFAGFDVLALANNHTPNFGEQGLKETYKYLSEAKIDYIGAGNNIIEARAFKIIEAKGLKFAFLAYNDNDVVPRSYFAGENRAGTAELDFEKMPAEVKTAKTQADFVIVSMHAGTEYAPQENKRQQEFARQAIDAGAVLVIGHHPHVVEPVERYKEGYILYSLGNFVFDQMWSTETRQGVITKISFNRQGIKDIEYQPIIIEDYSQPRFANDQEKDVILKRLLSER